MLYKYLLLATVALQVVDGTPTIRRTDKLGPLHDPVTSDLNSSLGIKSVHGKANTTQVTRAHSAPTDSVLRGVNIGSWLVLEKWLVPSFFEGSNTTDQCSYDALDIQDSKWGDRLREHWKSWFTEEDVKRLASYGFNALRIPIGYWAYWPLNNQEHYMLGADKFLEEAVTWAAKAGMKVLIDLHGAPGSQNGFDNSGCTMKEPQWLDPSYLDKTNIVLETMARKYGQKQYEDVVMGIQLINEPVSRNEREFASTKAWAQNITSVLSSSSEIPNRKLKFLMHDAFRNISDWLDVHKSINKNAARASDARFGLDTHLYQVYTTEDQAFNQDQHVYKACQWRETLRVAKKANMPIYAGEWSVATDICVWPNSTLTTPGTACSTPGCQCENVPVKDWSPVLVEQARRYVEAQLDTFHATTDGYFLWNFKAELGAAGPWSLYESIEKGIVPNPIWDRKYPNVCSD